ncbi:MAG: ribosomal protein S18-alanine N-acetyltransferase [Pseudomonadota bacterium]
MQLQPLSVQHFPSVMALELKAHSHPWSETNMESALSRHRCWGLFDADCLLGFTIFSLVLDEAELLDCVIDPALQGRGLGNRLLELSLLELQGAAQRIYLEVRESNAPAIALYQNHGFVEVGIRRDYYPSVSGREDALLMALETGSPFDAQA